MKALRYFFVCTRDRIITNIRSNATKKMARIPQKKTRERVPNRCPYLSPKVLSRVPFEVLNYPRCPARCFQKEESGVLLSHPRVRYLRNGICVPDRVLRHRRLFLVPLLVAWVRSDPLQKVVSPLRHLGRVLELRFQAQKRLALGLSLRRSVLDFLRRVSRKAPYPIDSRA